MIQNKMNNRSLPKISNIKNSASSHLLSPKKPYIILKASRSDVDFIISSCTHDEFPTPVTSGDTKTEVTVE